MTSAHRRRIISVCFVVALYSCWLFRGTVAVAQGATLTVSPPVATQGSTFTFALSGFQPGERVALWQTLPDSSVRPHRALIVNETGAATVRLLIDAGYPVGIHRLTAAGQQSTLQTVVQFELTAGDAIAPLPGDALLISLPEQVRRGATLLLVGDGFQAGETISFWVTFSDGVVVPIYTGITADGTFAATVGTADWPTGQHRITAFGNTSRERAIATVIVQPRN